MNYISHISPVTPIPTTAHAEPARGSAAADAQDSVIVDTIPPTPPDEVLQHIAIASQMYDKLLASGIRLHFETDPQTGRVAVQVLDTHGNVVGSLPAAKVIDLASGAALA